MSPDYSTNRLESSSSEKLHLKEELDKKDEKFAESAEVGGAVEAIGQTVETTGRISEVLREGGEVESDSAGSGQVAVGDAAASLTSTAVKTQLLRQVPSERMMAIQVEKEIKKEIKYLHKKAMKMMRSPGEVNHFEMTNLVGKIRELRKLLASLVKASVEGIKTLWLRFVHGIM